MISGQLAGFHGLIWEYAYTVFICQGVYTTMVLVAAVNAFKFNFILLIFIPWNGLLWFVIWPYEKELARVLREGRKKAKTAKLQDKNSNNGTGNAA